MKKWLDFFKLFSKSNNKIWLDINVSQKLWFTYYSLIYKLPYRVTSYTWPCVFGNLIKRDLSSVCYSTVAYTSATFFKVPEQLGHVDLVGLYLNDRYSGLLEPYASLNKNEKCLHSNRKTFAVILFSIQMTYL